MRGPSGLGASRAEEKGACRCSGRIASLRPSYYEICNTAFTVYPPSDISSGANQAPSHGFHESRDTKHESRLFIACFDRRVVRNAGWFQGRQVLRGADARMVREANGEAHVTRSKGLSCFCSGVAGGCPERQSPGRTGPPPQGCRRDLVATAASDKPPTLRFHAVPSNAVFRNLRAAASASGAGRLVDGSGESRAGHFGWHHAAGCGRVSAMHQRNR